MPVANEQESAFIQAILAAPDDDIVRLVFADWLEERGDSRGEFLRIATQLDREEQKAWPADSRARLRRVRELGGLRSRLRDLQQRIDPEWIIRFHRGSIQHCNMIFDGALFFPDDDKHCPGCWHHLKESDRPKTRRCDACSREVRFCWTMEEVHEALMERKAITTAMILERT